MLRALTLLAAAALATSLLTGPAGPAGAATTPTVLRLDGVGPLRLGMTRADAVRTGWLAGRGTGCKLGGPPYPITYRLKGRAAPKGLTGSAEFNGGKLTSLAFTKGVRTAAGVVVNRTTTAQMVSRYRARGYKAKASLSSLFGGTFVDVGKRGKQLLGGFATAKVVEQLAIPQIATCE
jgi:hypothetical protein